MQHFALIGSGFMGNVHAASLARHPAVSFDLVADIDEERETSMNSVGRLHCASDECGNVCVKSSPLSHWVR